MKIRIMIDRKVFAKLFSQRLGLALQYQGVPSFAYKIGPYTVCRDDTLAVEDAMADKEVLREMTDRDFLDGAWDENAQVLRIGFPLGMHTGRTLTNLVRLIAFRSLLINHAIGFSGFEITKELLDALEEEQPGNTDEFVQILRRDEVGRQRGFAIEGDRVFLQGFPDTQEPDKTKAFMNLASMMNAMAIRQKRINRDAVKHENEKYIFRIWLIRLGMEGNEYKTDRKILLSKLNGDAAFRTKEQRDEFYERMRVKRTVVETQRGGRNDTEG